MPFKNPFSKKAKEQPEVKSKLGLKILFWIIVAMLAYAIISQVF